jgi:hypothetical protein
MTLIQLDNYNVVTHYLIIEYKESADRINVFAILIHLLVTSEMPFHIDENEFSILIDCQIVSLLVDTTF